MVDIVLLAASAHSSFTTSSREPHEHGTTRYTSSGITKQSGLDLQKESPPAEAELFFLTSLFIELIECL